MAAVHAATSAIAARRRLWLCLHGADIRQQGLKGPQPFQLRRAQPDRVGGDNAAGIAAGKISFASIPAVVIVIAGMISFANIIIIVVVSVEHRGERVGPLHLDRRQSSPTER